MGQLVFQAALGGQVNLVGPNTASTLNINVPAFAGTMASLASVNNNGVAYVNSSGQPTTLSTFVFDGTNLGIGVTPTYKLDVTGVGRITGNADQQYNFRVQYSSTGFGIYQDDTIGYTRISAYDTSGTTYAKGLTFATAPAGSATAERMRITPAGDVGIGTTSPSTKFHVVGEITATQGVGGTPALSFYASSATTITQGTFTKIGLQTSVFDTTSGMFASSRFTPTVAGYYQVNAAIAFGSSVLTQQDAIAIYKNGSSYQIGNYIPDTGGLGLRAVMSTIVYCNGSTDYIELYGIYNAGPATQAISTGSGNTWFNACLIRGA